MTVALYIRVSTTEQAKEGYSIPAQKERLIAYCTAQGWTDFKFYIDEGVSAKDTNRPELKHLMEDVKKEKISMILVYRLDRFTRSVRDLYNMLETLEKYNCSFKSATELYDTSSAMGRMFIGLVALLAQWETENLSERVKMALEEKVSGGERVGGIPFGFDLNEQEKLVSNEKSTVILDMIQLLKSGKSVNAIANYLSEVNNDKVIWHPNAIFRLLRNPALYGATKWNEKVYENTHKGIITKEEFYQIQLMLDDQSQHRRREVECIYLFQGVLSCPNCERPLSVNRYVRKRKDGSEYQGAIYKCQACYKEGKKMIQIGEQRLLDSLYEYMKNAKPIEVKPNIKIEVEHEKLESQLSQIEKKREKFQKAWAADLISDEEFEKRMDETRNIYNNLKTKLSQIETPVPINTEVIKKIIVSFNEFFYFFTEEEKRKFISQFVRKINFILIPQPPKNYRNKKGKEKIVITDILYY